MKYAIVTIKGHQYKVSEGQELLVDKLNTDKPEVNILLYVDEDQVKIGKPFLTDVKVQAKVLEKEVKGEKLYIQKFKAKSRYRRKTGFRPKFSKLLISKISL